MFRYDDEKRRRERNNMPCVVLCCTVLYCVVYCVVLRANTGITLFLPLLLPHRYDDEDVLKRLDVRRDEESKEKGG